jgi:hypothetical protein
MAEANACNADTLGPDYSAGNVIYVFEEEVDPEEIGVIDPYTTVEAKDEDNDGNYEYRASLMPGKYMFAATCQGANDGDGFDGIDPTTFFLPVQLGESVVDFDVAGDITGPSF